MKNSRPYSIFTTSLLVMLLITLTVARVSSTETTIMQPNPKHIQSSIGQSFTVNITLTNVNNLNTWQLYILFNPTILNCTQIWVPPNSIFNGYETFWPTPKINNTAGYILALCALTEPFGVNNSGILCQIEFSCKTPGITPLSIGNKMQAPTGTYLMDPNYTFIPFEAFDGMIQVTAPGFQEYLFEATQNSQTYPVIILSNSTVTSFNYDQYLKTMSFDATGADDTKGFTSIAFLKELLNGTLAVLVDEEANYYYTSFENETYTFLYFSYTHSMRHIKILLTVIGDVNGDRIVDMADISIIIDAFLTEPGHRLWNACADLNHDNMVDMVDISIAIDNFLETWSP